MALTTATSPVVRDFATNRVIQAVVTVCAAVWLWAAIDPVYRMDWFLENLMVFAAVATLIVVYRTHPLSQISWVFIGIFFTLHVLGSHYTYSEVPWGLWLQRVLETERNHYDRVVHFTFGLLLTYPVRELLMRSAGLRGFKSYFFAFAVMVASSEIYELIEWITAEIVSPEAAYAFLGTQGDPFDAQKDTFLAFTGTVLALGLTRLLERPPP
jgi:putative membrane protein